MLHRCLPLPALCWHLLLPRSFLVLDSLTIFSVNQTCHLTYSSSSSSARKKRACFSYAKDGAQKELGTGGYNSTRLGSLEALNRQQTMIAAHTGYLHRVIFIFLLLVGMNVFLHRLKNIAVSRIFCRMLTMK